MIDSIILKLVYKILKTLANFITGYAYTYLEAHKVIKYIMMVLTVIIVIVCSMLILFNSFKGISQILNELFGIDSYKYIDALNIDLENNFSKLYLPEFIISCTGLATIMGILLYIISYEKHINKPDEPDETDEPDKPSKFNFPNLFSKSTVKKTSKVATEEAVKTEGVIETIAAVGAVGAIGAVGAVGAVGLGATIPSEIPSIPSEIPSIPSEIPSIPSEIPSNIPSLPPLSSILGIFSGLF